MPAKGANGRFISNDELAIKLPSIFTMFKILIISIILYPWYYILSRQNYFTLMFEYVFFNNKTTPTQSGGAM